MHSHLEVIMPPSKDIQKDLGAIMEPFSKNNKEATHAFWDFFIIGGRWAGTKESCRYSPEKLEQFYKRMIDEQVTVSGLQCGKQTLDPDSQIPKVDKMWNDLFPTETGEITPCPIFSHSNNQYDSNDLLACDICRVDEIPDTLVCSRVIIAGPNHDGTGIEAQFMLCDEQWNGFNHMKVDWDGKLPSALTKYAEKLKRYREEYVEKATPKPEWICVTVDYHS